MSKKNVAGDYDDRMLQENAVGECGVYVCYVSVWRSEEGILTLKGKYVNGFGVQVLQRSGSNTVGSMYSAESGGG